jgi:hypothetical protein
MEKFSAECGSGLWFVANLDSDPGFNNSNRKGEGKICLSCPFLLSQLIEHVPYRKKYEPRVLVIFTQKIVTKLSKYG